MSVRRAVTAIGLAGGVFVGAWGLSQRLRPRPIPPYLAFLLENRLTASVVGPELLLDRAGLSPGMKVLDAGCGPGRITVPAARRVGTGGEVVALDGQRAMLDKLVARLAEEGITNVRPLKAKLGAGEPPQAWSESLPETFERVLLSMVIGEIRGRRRAFAELYRATAPGGMLSLTETLAPDYRRRGTVRREIEAAGFRFEHLYGGRISYTMNFAKPLRDLPEPEL